MIRLITSHYVKVSKNGPKVTLLPKMTAKFVYDFVLLYISNKTSVVDYEIFAHQFLCETKIGEEKSEKKIQKKWHVTTKYPLDQIFQIFDGLYDDSLYRKLRYLD